jgi:hypothetical protein
LGRERISGYSRWSLILGILSIIFSFLLGLISVIIGIIGVILSRKAVKEIKTNGIGSKRLATAGLICSIIGIVIPIISIILGVTLLTFHSAPQ